MMRKKYWWCLVVIIIATFIFIPKIIKAAEESIGRLNFVCEMKNGLLFGIDDGFSILDKCPNGSRKVAINGTNSSGGLKVVDAKGMELGIFTSSADNQFYYPKQGLIIKYGADGSINSEYSVQYANSDCSGEAYIAFDDYFFNLYSFGNFLYKSGNGKYYSVKNAVNGEFAFKSYADSVTGKCEVSESSAHAYVAEEVEAPFGGQAITMPVHYVYE